MYPYTCTLMLDTTEVGSGSGIPYASRKSTAKISFSKGKLKCEFG